LGKGKEGERKKGEKSTLSPLQKVKERLKISSISQRSGKAN